MFDKSWSKGEEEERVGKGGNLEEEEGKGVKDSCGGNGNGRNTIG